MSGFGDSEPEDSFVVNNPLDPEQVARRLHEVRRHHNRETVEWDDLDEDERAVLVAIIVILLTWMAREGSFS